MTTYMLLHEQTSLTNAAARLAGHAGVLKLRDGDGETAARGGAAESPAEDDVTWSVAPARKGDGVDPRDSPTVLSLDLLPVIIYLHLQDGIDAPISVWHTRYIGFLTRYRCARLCVPVEWTSARPSHPLSTR